MGDVRIELNAYAKLFLHAAKYRHCAVNGLLVAENKGRGTKDELIIVDAVPLFHHSHNLAPMAEIALTKVDVDLQANKRMIVGYYAACENFYDNTPDKCPTLRIPEKILEYFPKAVFLVINNLKFCPTTGGTVVKGYKYNDNKWKAMEPESLIIDIFDLDVISYLLSQEASKMLVDFDNYLDDIRLDWTNRSLEKYITKMDGEIKSGRQDVPYNEDDTSQDSSE